MYGLFEIHSLGITIGSHPSSFLKVFVGPFLLSPGVSWLNPGVGLRIRRVETEEGRRDWDPFGLRDQPLLPIDVLLSFGRLTWTEVLD